MKNLTSLDILEQLSGEIAWKDKNFNYLGCNANRARILNFKHTSEIVGLSDKNLLDQTKESMIFHRQHDELALKGEVIETIHPSMVANNGVTYYQIKKPLQMHAKTIGVIYHCVEFRKPELFTQLQLVDKKFFPSSVVANYYHLDKNFFLLSPRELECLFCLLRGMSAKLTSDLIKISKRTVEYYLNNIKNKLGCQNKTELIIKAIEAGYIDAIPKRFLEMDWKNFLSYVT